MRRRLFTLAAGASAVLWVAACALWVQSYWRLDTWDWGTAARKHSICNQAGGVVYCRIVAAGGASIVWSVRQGYNSPAVPAVPAGRVASLASSLGWLARILPNVHVSAGRGGSFRILAS
jgi:hypothetical protein